MGLPDMHIVGKVLLQLAVCHLPPGVTLTQPSLPGDPVAQCAVSTSLDLLLPV